MSGAEARRSLTRRQLLERIGTTAGAAALYNSMTALGFAHESPWRAPVDLRGAPKNTSVLVLGAGVAGMTAAYELRNAGYDVKVLEYNSRAGGRNWTLRGGDVYTELGGARQACEFDDGLYLDPGPWRIPHHHRGILSYCRRLGIAMQPFVQANSNTYLHNSRASGGHRRRFREVKADYQGHVAELLAKATRAHALDEALSREDQEKLLESLRSWGALDSRYAYVSGGISSERRGYIRAPGGGLAARPEYSGTAMLSDVLDSGLWKYLASMEPFDMQPSLLQPEGGMGRIGEAFARDLGPLIQYNKRVVEIRQDESGVTVRYEDLTEAGMTGSARAQWCLCTIPLSILSQIPMNVSVGMAAAIGATPYASSTKIGLQFRRRFWEQDDGIYGGTSYTDLPIGLISYPSHALNSDGKGVLLGAYTYGRNSLWFTGMNPAERVGQAVEFGSQIHPQYRKEFENGIAVAWHRVPWALGCFAMWDDESRARHYDALCAVDGRIALAGEHASYLHAWQEGSVTSALDAISRIHSRVVAS
jgi:monoamine oxidase